MLWDPSEDENMLQAWQSTGQIIYVFPVLLIRSAKDTETGYISNCKASFLRESWRIFTNNDQSIFYPSPAFSLCSVGTIVKTSQEQMWQPWDTF